MRSLSAGQGRLLIFGAVAGLLAVCANGASMLWAVPALAIIFLLYMCVQRAIPDGQGLCALLPAWVLWLELAFLVLAAARAADYVSLAWHNSPSFPLFPLALLALAAAQTSLGTAAAGRCAVILGWAEIIFFAVILTVTAVESKPPQNVGAPVEGISVLFCLLVACAGLFLPTQKDRRSGILWGGLAVTTMLILFVTAGKGGTLPMLTAVKSAEFFGVLERFEALCSCAITAGLFLMLTLLGCIGGEILHVLRLEKLPAAAPLVPAAGLLLITDLIPGWVYAVGAGIFWGLVPLAALAVVGNKMDRKKMSENQ